jgi:hypothetical protein
MTSATKVLWLSDGAKGFWRVYQTCFASCAIGILDFYHAAGHLWRAAATVFDGRTTEAQTWFENWRHQLRHGHHRQVITNLTQLINTDLFNGDELEILQQVQAYFQSYHEHIRYAHFKQQGFPLGSGMIESTWTIRAKFVSIWV